MPGFRRLSFSRLKSIGYNETDIQKARKQLDEIRSFCKHALEVIDNDERERRKSVAERKDRATQNTPYSIQEEQRKALQQELHELTGYIEHAVSLGKHYDSKLPAMKKRIV